MKRVSGGGENNKRGVADWWTRSRDLAEIEVEHNFNTRSCNPGSAERRVEPGPGNALQRGLDSEPGVDPGTTDNLER